MLNKLKIKNNSNYIDLFNNPMVEVARENLSKKDIDKYKFLGEEFYKNIDFTTSNINASVAPTFMSDGIFYIDQALKSGLNPDDLDEEEINFIRNLHGNNWYEKWKKNKSFDF